VAPAERKARRGCRPAWRQGSVLGLLVVTHSAIGLAGILVALLVFAAVALVVGPAIWSRKQFRRDAALAVLECLLRHR
jgi:hypothetical protein